MAATSLLARLGLRVATLGSAASLAIAAPLAEGDVSQAAHGPGGTGWFFPTATSIGTVTAGVERMRLYADGGIRINGTIGASPGAGSTVMTCGTGSVSFLDTTLARTSTGIVQFANTTSAQNVEAKGSGADIARFGATGGLTYFGSFTSTDVQFLTNNAEKIRLYADGGVQIGGTFAVSPGVGVLALGLGAVAAPSLTFIGDTNTGIFSPTADQIGFTTGATERMRLYADGGVQIGGSIGGSPGANVISLRDVNAILTFRADGTYTSLALEGGGGQLGQLTLNSDGAASTTPQARIRFTTAAGSANEIWYMERIGQGPAVSNRMSFAYGSQAAHPEIMAMYQDGGVQIGGTFAASPGAGITKVNGRILGDVTSSGVRSNLAIQFGAGNAANTGTDNIAIGAYALSSSTVGDNNVSIGTWSMWEASGGSNNIALGLYSLSKTSGHNNVALGYNALLKNAGQSNNIAIGWVSLSSATANDNTAVGGGAGYSVTTGHSNVLIGYSAGYWMTTGFNNVWIGKNAGYVGSPLVTAENSIAIGYEATVTGNNQVVIGNTAIVSTRLQGAVSFVDNVTERMRVYADGGVQIGGTMGTSPGAGVLQIVAPQATVGLSLLSGFIGGVNPPDINFYRSLSSVPPANPRFRIRGSPFGAGDFDGFTLTSHHVADVYWMQAVATTGVQIISPVGSGINSDAAANVAFNTRCNFLEGTLVVGIDTVASTAAVGGTIRSGQKNGAVLDVAGSRLTLQSGRGTGAGAVSGISFSTPDVTVSGTALQAITEKMRIYANGGVQIGGAFGTSLGAGTLLVAGLVEFDAADNHAITQVAVDTSLDATQYTILVDASGGARFITLPDSTATSNINGRVYHVKKIDASTNTVTVQRAGASDQIDGATTSVLTVQYQARTYQCRTASAAANRWSII